MGPCTPPRGIASDAMTTARVQITRPDKLLWPSIGVTKQAYVDYLGAVAGLISRGCATGPSR